MPRFQLKRRWKLLLTIILVPVFLALIYLTSVVALAVLTDWQPKGISRLIPVGQSGKQSLVPDTLSFYTWNIGYAGLGAEMDFFYDGGSQVRASRELHAKYLEAIAAFLASSDSVDFFLLQEVDSASDRTYGTDEYTKCRESLPAFASSFAKNYDVNFVPVPYTNPMGKAHAGLSSFFRYPAVSADRHQYPGELPFFQRLFLLDRCAQVLRFEAKSGKQLVVINTHNTTYDDGEVKELEMEYLKIFFLEEYNKGNYVIAGGDWNQCPPFFDPRRLGMGDNSGCEGFTIPAEILPEDWIWVWDPEIPSNRKLDEVYNPETARLSWIDFYVVSPNVRVLRCHGVEQGFAFSDHHPVFLKIALL